jgi:hypothetical protein
MNADLGTPYAALYVSHQVADHWIQTSCQSAGKGGDGWPGRIACAKHVAGHMATSVVCLSMLNIIGVHVALGPMAAGLAVVAVTHYWADRRAPLRKLAYRLGKKRFYHLGNPAESLGTGAYALDQSFHFWWLFVAAITMMAV